MHTRRLGDSDLHVSEISLGSWLTYGVGVEADEARGLPRRRVRRRASTSSTPPTSTAGRRRKLPRRGARRPPARQLRPRHQAVLPDERRRQRGLSRAQVHKQLDASLQRLRTDYVDLYQCHRYDDDTPLEETMEALSEVVRSGKVRYLGFSEWPADTHPGRRSTWPGSRNSSPASRNTACCSAIPRKR